MRSCLYIFLFHSILNVSFAFDLGEEYFNVAIIHKALETESLGEAGVDLLSRERFVGGGMSPEQNAWYSEALKTFYPEAIPVLVILMERFDKNAKTIIRETINNRKDRESVWAIELSFPFASSDGIISWKTLTLFDYFHQLE